MTLFVLVFGIALFSFAMGMHVLMWNLFRIRKEILWLAIVFFAVPGVTLVSVWVTGLLDATVIAACGMLYTALAVVYIQTYPALREDIPSIHILMSVYNHSESMTNREIIEYLASQRFHESKITDLENDSLVRIRDDRLYFTSLGRKLADIFYFYRKLLGRETGRG